MSSATSFETQSRIANWIACRRRSANGDPAQLFFLELDMQSAEPLMYDWDPPRKAERVGWVHEIGRLLHVRMAQRARGLNPGPSNERAKQGLSVVSSFMREALWTHFADNRRLIENAFDRFAAGMLKQSCGTINVQLRDIVACDADSSAIFYFAELALSLIELDMHQRAYWSQLLNCFVRAQAIYLARWANSDPQCFAKYKGEIPPLSRLPEGIAWYYRWVGDDPNRLDAAYRANLARVVLDQSCLE